MSLISVLSVTIIPFEQSPLDFSIEFTGEMEAGQYGWIELYSPIPVRDPYQIDVREDATNALVTHDLTDFIGQIYYNESDTLTIQETANDTYEYWTLDHSGSSVVSALLDVRVIPGVQVPEPSSWILAAALIAFYLVGYWYSRWYLSARKSRTTCPNCGRGLDRIALEDYRCPGCSAPLERDIVSMD